MIFDITNSLTFYMKKICVCFSPFAYLQEKKKKKECSKERSTEQI